MAYLTQAGLCYQTVRLYLSALRYYQISYGGPDPSTSPSPHLDYVIKGIRKSQPTYTRPRRLPITPAILHTLYTIWSPDPTFNTTALWAACCLGFFAFLRAGEFTCPSRQAYTHSMLSPTDIQVDSRQNPSYLRVTLRSSKTDVFGAGVSIYIGSSHNELCPVTAVLSYLARRPSSPGPLFILENGTPLSRRFLIQHVRQALAVAGLDVTNFNGHSFRIGADTTASLVGISDSNIQLLGRWKSNAFTRYIRSPTNLLLSTSQTLTQTT